GHGLTGAWPRGEYTIEAYDDFIEVLADTLRLDRFAIAGHSMGGAVAWNFAATRPERVTQLILVDSAGFPKGGTPPLTLRLARPAGGRVRRPLQAGHLGPPLARGDLRRPGDGDVRAREALRRTAALSRQPRRHAVARAHPGGARSLGVEASQPADADPVGRQG